MRSGSLLSTLAVVVSLIAVGLIACAPERAAPESDAEPGVGSEVEPEAKAEEPGMSEARRVLEAHRQRWHAVPGVQGTGVGVHEGRTVIFVYVTEDSAALRDALPEQQDGVPLVVRPVGPIEPLE